jgi:trimethylamine--corrinoid protein Co-methyltransferase
MRPVLRLLSDELIREIISEARDVLCRLGVEIHNDGILSMLSDHGASVDLGKKHVNFTGAMIDKALAAAPDSVELYDVLGRKTHELTDHNVYFTPGSAAINILDPVSGEIRKPSTADYVEYARLISRLDNIASQSTAFIPADVHERISDSYRLYLSLRYCEKPVVTGAFTIDAFNIMRDLQLAVRGSADELRKKPLTIFSCCPTAPLKWSDVTSQNLIDCAKAFIPVEYVSMPLSGFMAPVTLVGSIVQHTAETLSGVVLSQLAQPGAPIIYGGSPAAFDIRYETPPMGAVETQMIDCANNEIGKYLNLPTQAYIALSDAKQLDAQAGLETSMGATLAALSGINSISGPGMLDFESCQSLEKLVVDNEICGMTLRLIRGVEPKEDFPSIPIFEELLRDGHLLIADHTRKYLRDEHYFPGAVIDRANSSRWKAEGSLTIGDRAKTEIERLLAAYEPTGLSDDVLSDMTGLMKKEASRFGMDSLPHEDL